MLLVSPQAHHNLSPPSWLYCPSVRRTKIGVTKWPCDEVNRYHSSYVVSIIRQLLPCSCFTRQHSISPFGWITYLGTHFPVGHYRVYTMEPIQQAIIPPISMVASLFMTWSFVTSYSRFTTVRYTPVNQAGCDEVTESLYCGTLLLHYRFPNDYDITVTQFT